MYLFEMMIQSALGKIFSRTTGTLKPFFTSVWSMISIQPILRLLPRFLTFELLCLSPVDLEVSLQLLFVGEGPVTGDTEMVSLVNMSPVAAPGRGRQKGGVTGRTDEGLLEFCCNSSGLCLGLRDH